VRALEVPDRRDAYRTGRFRKWVWVLAVSIVASYSLMTAFAPSHAYGDVGELGPPPAEPEIKQVLTDLYNAGQPLGSTVDVTFDGPILVGLPAEHANPPPEPWCVRCGYPDQGISLMYPVAALVTVTVNQSLQSSALAPSETVASTATYNGTPCPGVTQSLNCPTYYFYRDGQGNWQVA